MALIADFVSGQSNVTYTRMRELLLESGGGLQEGVVGTTDLKVAQRGAGAAQNVDIPAGAGWITVDTGTRNGISHAFNDAVANVTVAASDGTNPRIDQACLQYNDTAIPAGTGGNIPTFRILTGTATAAADLTNRLGAAALPNDCLRLADILVPATSTSVTTANIRDRRPSARGAVYRYTLAAQASTASGAAVSLIAAQIIEIGANPLLLMWNAQTTGAGTRGTSYELRFDAATQRTIGAAVNGSSDWAATGFVCIPSPGAGTHTVDVRWFSNDAVSTVFTRAGAELLVQEIVRPITNVSV